MVVTTNIDEEELIMGIPICKFYDFEIEQVITEYLTGRDIASKTPNEVAREIVDVAGLVVPQGRKVGKWKPSDRHKLSAAIKIALRKLVRHDLHWPTPWLTKHFTAFRKFAISDGRLKKAQRFCFDCQVDEAVGVMEAFLTANGLREMGWLGLRYEASKFLLLRDQLRGHVPVLQRCPECDKKARLARRVAKTSTIS
jgi:hypothetical protein